MIQLKVDVITFCYKVNLIRNSQHTLTHTRRVRVPEGYGLRSRSKGTAWESKKDGVRS